MLYQICHCPPPLFVSLLLSSVDGIRVAVQRWHGRRDDSIPSSARSHARTHVEEVLLRVAFTCERCLALIRGDAE